MFEAIKNFFETLGAALAPFAYGLAFAFLVSPIYNKIRKKLPKWVCLVIALLIILLAFALLGFLIVPQVVDSVALLISQLPDYIKSLDSISYDLLNHNPEIASIIEKYYSGVGDSIDTWFENSFMPNISTYLSAATNGLISVVVVFKDIIIGLIVMVYFLGMKDTAKSRAKKICYSVLSIDKANTFIEDCRFTYDVFSNFLVGKIIDSLIIGVLTFIVISIFRIPYASLIAIIVGVTNVIPFFGPFIGAIPCALLLLVVSPSKCILFIIIIFIIQQLDGNIIGPKILGDKTGVSSFWVLFSILLFGGLFGFVGMVIAVPVFAVIYRLIKRLVYEKLWAKNLSTHTKDYDDLEKIDEETKEYIKKDGDTDTTGDLEG